MSTRGQNIDLQAVRACMLNVGLFAIYRAFGIPVLDLRQKAAGLLDSGSNRDCLPRR